MPTGSRDRAFRCLVMKANRNNGGGEVCHGCGRALRSREATLTGRDRQGGPIVVAQCCVRRLATIIGYGLFVSRDEDPNHVFSAARDLHLAMVEPKGRA